MVMVSTQSNVFKSCDIPTSRTTGLLRKWGYRQWLARIYRWCIGKRSNQCSRGSRISPQISFLTFINRFALLFFKGKKRIKREFENCSFSLLRLEVPLSLPPRNYNHRSIIFPTLDYSPTFEEDRPSTNP